MKPLHFEIMDTSGNRPIIKTRQAANMKVTAEVHDNDVIKLKNQSDEVVVDIKVTGFETKFDDVIPA